MKKMILLFTAALTMMSATIVNDSPKGHGLFQPQFRGKFEPAEFQKAMLLLVAEKQDQKKIAQYFIQIDGCSYAQMKEICREWLEEAFDEEDITDAEMKKIIQNLDFRFPEDDYWENHSSMYIPNEGGSSLADMEWSHPKGVRKNEQIASCKYLGKAVDLFTTYCGNATKKDKIPIVKKKKAVVEEEEELETVTEYVRIPGKKKVITYETDTVEINRSKVQIERTNNEKFVFNNNQSYEVDMTSKYASNNQREYNNSCGCPQQAYSKNCGCSERYICQDHEKQIPKEKKKFFNTAVGKGVIFLAGAGAGYFTRYLIDKNNPTVVYRNGVQQPPFVPIIPQVQQPPFVPLPVYQPAFQ